MARYTAESSIRYLATLVSAYERRALEEAGPLVPPRPPTMEVVMLGTPGRLDLSDLHIAKLREWVRLEHPGYPEVEEKYRADVLARGLPPGMMNVWDWAQQYGLTGQDLTSLGRSAAWGPLQRARMYQRARVREMVFR